MLGLLLAVICFLKKDSSFKYSTHGHLKISLLACLKVFQLASCFSISSVEKYICIASVFYTI